MSESVISVDFNQKKIKKVIKNYLNKRYPSYIKNPYFKRDSAKTVIKILKKIDLKKIRLKKFYESEK